METLLLILAAVFIVSCVSLVGAATLFLKQKLLDRILFYFMSFSAGTMLGAAFLDLLPEALGGGRAFSVMATTLAGLMSFFILERFIHWHHFHKGGDAHPFTYLNLIGDGVHNLLDGIAIAAAFLSSVPIGVSTTLAVIAHEVPQELGDFGLLIYGGLSKKKALLFNFVSALTAVAGALVTFFLSSSITSETINLLLAFTAGGFIYIATADLVPEIHKEREFRKIIPQLILFITGILIVGGIKIFIAE